MTNYYEDLNIDRALGISEINKELSQLESTWKRREITNPEKATTMLALIIQARKAFQSAATRAEYDQALSESKKPPKSETEKRDELVSLWFNRAKGYYDTKQYDLAKTAIEKAVYYSDTGRDDTELFALAADIYCKNNNTSTAVEYINKAIVIHPEVADYYIKKGLIFERIAQLNKSANRYGEANESYRSMQKMLELAITKAQFSGDKYAEGAAKGTLAFALYYYLNDKEKAEILAKDTIGSKNDSWGNAQRVLDDINKQRTETEKRESEKLEAEKRQKEHQRIESEKKKRLEQKKKTSEIIKSIFCVVLFIPLGFVITKSLNSDLSSWTRWLETCFIPLVITEALAGIGLSISDNTKLGNVLGKVIIPADVVIVLIFTVKYIQQSGDIGGLILPVVLAIMQFPAVIVWFVTGLVADKLRKK